MRIASTQSEVIIARVRPVIMAMEQRVLRGHALTICVLKTKNVFHQDLISVNVKKDSDAMMLCSALISTNVPKFRDVIRALVARTRSVVSNVPVKKVFSVMA